MKRRGDSQDVFDEPWMKPGADGADSAGQPAPAEPPSPPPLEDAVPLTADQTELENVLHSAYSEPERLHTAAPAETELSQLIAHKRAGLSPIALSATVLLTAVLAGPISILGTFAAGGQGFFGGLYLVAGGPVIEEMMKLGGLLYLLEKKPWYVTKGWHIVAAAGISALLFGVIENLVYGGIYLSRMSSGAREDIMQFRWAVTVLLHLGATLIGAIGLRKAWLATVAKGRLFDSQVAEPYIAAAVVVHGGYNAVALLLNGFMVDG